MTVIVCLRVSVVLPGSWRTFAPPQKRVLLGNRTPRGNGLGQFRRKFFVRTICRIYFADKGRIALNHPMYKIGSYFINNSALKIKRG